MKSHQSQQYLVNPAPKVDFLALLVKIPRTGLRNVEKDGGFNAAGGRGSWCIHWVKHPRFPTPHHTTGPEVHLKFDAWRRDKLPDNLLYATPQELLDMEEREPAELRLRFLQALEHVRETLRLHPSDLQLPTYASPQYYKQLLAGYEGGAFDPATLGAAYVVVPDTSSARVPNPCTWNLHQVPTPCPPS